MLANSTGHFIKVKFISIIRTVRSTHTRNVAQQIETLYKRQCVARGGARKRKTGKHRKTNGKRNYPKWQIAPWNQEKNHRQLYSI